MPTLTPMHPIGLPLDDGLVGAWVRRSPARPAHAVDSVVADAIVTACGRTMRHGEGRRLLLDDRGGHPLEHDLDPDCEPCARIIRRRA